MPHIHENTEPAPFLVEHLGLLPVGRVLDIAMGNGRNAIYLAKHGFEVEGVDLSPEAIKKALEAARREKVVIEAQVADLEKDYHIKPGYYDAIICFYYLQRSLIPQMKEGLKRGGIIVYETFLIEQMQWGKPKNPDFLLRHNELLDLFRGFRILRYREGIFEDRGDKRAIASLVAEKLD